MRLKGNINISIAEYKGEKKISSDIPEHSSKTQTSVEIYKKEVEQGLGYC